MFRESKTLTPQFVISVISVCAFLGSGIVDVIRRIDHASEQINELNLRQAYDHKTLEVIQSDIKDLRDCIKKDKTVLIDTPNKNKIN